MTSASFPYSEEALPLLTTPESPVTKSRPCGGSSLLTWERRDVGPVHTARPEAHAEAPTDRTLEEGLRELRPLFRNMDRACLGHLPHPVRLVHPWRRPTTGRKTLSMAFLGSADLRPAGISSAKTWREGFHVPERSRTVRKPPGPGADPSGG
jgi:hypothetical protein